MSAMKRKRSPERQLPGPQMPSKTIEEMVNSKVRVVIEELESTRKEQQQKMKDLDVDEKNFEEKLKKLKAHIQKVKRRGDAAMAYLRQRHTPGKTICLDQRSGLRSLSTTPPADSCAPGAVTSSRNSDSGDGSSDGWLMAENDNEEAGSGQSRRKAVEGFWQGWRGRMQLVDLTAEDIPVDLPEQSCSERSNTSSHVTTSLPKEVKVKVEEDRSFSNGPPQSMSTPQPAPEPCPSPPLRLVKAEPESPKPVSIKTEETPYAVSESAAQQQAMNTSQVTSTIPIPPSSLPAQNNTTDSKANIKGGDDPKFKKILVRDANVHGDDWKKQLHPLPDRSFPTTLPLAAASKNVPQALSVKVWRSGSDPNSLFLRWQVAEEDPHAPPMDSYFIYVAQQNLDGVFSRWSMAGSVPASPLPMNCHLSEFPSYRCLCFAVVGRDKFGRFGPYSEVVGIYAKSVKPVVRQ
ncbi:activating transcription factor 7 interacting protein 2 isoform X1 [Alosa pseudoharengus]|uniref:activating transcription factor 7 interacting protein 2 isoform X1 n=2 Tax=Alosa pseudoharengus TaxID=34774 RepID=UPI003F8C0945